MPDETTQVGCLSRIVATINAMPNAVGSSTSRGSAPIFFNSLPLKVKYSAHFECVLVNPSGQGVSNTMPPFFFVARSAENSPLDPCQKSTSAGKLLETV